MISPSARPVNSVNSDTATTTKTAIPVDRAAATGAPIASATPTTTASTREPTAVGAKPAPSNARAGTAIKAIATGTDHGRPAASGAHDAGDRRHPAEQDCSERAPRRAVRMDASRWPVGSGRQFGDQGFAGPMAGDVPSFWGFAVHTGTRG